MESICAASPTRYGQSYFFQLVGHRGFFDHKVDEGILNESTFNCSFEAIPVYFAGNEVRYFYKTKKLLSLLRKFAPEVIHVEQGATALSFAQVICCSRYLGLKPCFTFFYLD